MAIPQIYEINTWILFGIVVCNTDGGDLCKQIRRNFYGNARVSEKMT